jgi:hypothetical protein
VRPEHIHITDNAIIPPKEPVVDSVDYAVNELLQMATG